jgi:hypothetical protein
MPVVGKLCSWAMTPIKLRMCKTETSDHSSDEEAIYKCI